MAHLNTQLLVHNGCPVTRLNTRPETETSALTRYCGTLCCGFKNNLSSKACPSFFPPSSSAKVLVVVLYPLHPGTQPFEQQPGHTRHPAHTAPPKNVPARGPVAPAQFNVLQTILGMF